MASKSFMCWPMSIAVLIVIGFLFLSFLSILSSVDRIDPGWQQDEAKVAVCKALLASGIDLMLLYCWGVHRWDRKRHQEGCTCWFDGYAPHRCHKCKFGFTLIGDRY